MLELHPLARAGVRVARLVAVVVDVVIALTFEAQAWLVPGAARVGAHRLAVVLDDEANRQQMVAAVLDGLVRDAGLQVKKRVAVDYATGNRSSSALRGQLAFMVGAS